MPIAMKHSIAFILLACFLLLHPQATLAADEDRQQDQEEDEVMALEEAINGVEANSGKPYKANNEFLGIPGTTQTKNGYDTALGDQPICWRGVGAQNNSDAAAEEDGVDALVRTVFPNPLVEGFVLDGEIEIVKECPEGNSINVQQPLESLHGERLRTMRQYNYSLEVNVSLDSLDGEEIIADDGTATIALQVVLCSLGKSGFCSPFVHEQGM